MKNLTKSLFVLAFALMALGCHEEEVTNNKVMISFGIDQKDVEAGRTSETQVPAALVISIAKADGASVIENKKLTLLQFGQGYVTEGVELAVGNYKITKFLVLNSSDKIIYATPLEGSDKASLVSDPLPINFTVTSNSSTPVTPQVLKVEATDTPQAFGYASFGFSVVENSAVVKLKLKVQLQVGEILYQDVNSTIKVRGFDSLNNIKWMQDFAYTGPNDNELSLKAGYHHYSAEVHQWGINDIITITRDHLVESRADGPAPVTYILGGATQPKKIKSYISYSQVSDGTGGTVMRPDLKVEYEYGFNGKVSKMTVFGYNTETSQYEAQRYFNFTYEGTRVSKIVGFLLPANTQYIEDKYYYDTFNNISIIQENNSGAGVSAQVNFTYQYPSSSILAEYSFSNGGAFSYQFSYAGKNIATDLTKRGSELCSSGTYTYDKNINPLRHTGYIDFTLREYSINNRVTENVNYVACAFPTLIPESYAYQYDGDGYPTLVTKYYKPNSAGNQAIMQTKYFYQ